MLLALLCRPLQECCSRQASLQLHTSLLLRCTQWQDCMSTCYPSQDCLALRTLSDGTLATRHGYSCDHTCYEIICLQI